MVIHVRTVSVLVEARVSCLHVQTNVRAAAAVATAAVVLGDDSLLTKYLNPHLIAIISSSNPVEFTSGDSTIELRLVDSVSGKLVWSRVIRHASLPVHAVRQENCLITTYWNAKVRPCFMHLCMLSS